MDKWLDPYLGPGATDRIWFWPHSENPEKLRNVLSSGTAEICEHNVRREACQECSSHNTGSQDPT